MGKLPPLRSVQAFEAVGRCGSVRAAADDLNVSPGAITQQVQALQKHLGVRLVQRTGRGIALTSLGTRFLHDVTASLEQLRRGTREIERAQQSKRLTVHALPSLANQWLTPLLAEWKKLHPDVDIVLESEEQEPKLDDGEADYRVSYGRRHRAHRRYAYLFTDEVLPVGNPELIASLGKALEKPSDVLRYPLLWIDWGPEYMATPTWVDWLAHAGVAGARPRCDFTFSLSSAAIEAAATGLGLLLAQRSMITRAVATGDLVQLFDGGMPLPESYFLAWSATAAAQPLDAAFRAWLTGAGKRFDRRAEAA